MTGRPRPTVESLPGGNVRIVYALVDPVTDEVRYVGQTRDPFWRLMNHLADALTRNRKHNRAKDEWVAGLLFRHGMFPKVEILEFVEGKAYAAERRWIEHFRAAGAPLLNKSNATTDPAALERIRAGNRGRVHSPEERAKRSASLLAFNARRREGLA